MSIIQTLSEMESASRIEGLEGTITGAVIARLAAADPDHIFPSAKKGGESEGFSRINRNGVVYYAKDSYRILNPYHSSGVGLCFAKATDDDPTGVFFTEGIEATAEERFEAVKAYLYEFGVPRGEVVLAPAVLFPRTYEKTPENIAALKDAGALLLHG